MTKVNGITFNLFQRGAIWYVNLIAPDGRRLRRSLGTTDKKEAEQIAKSWIKHDECKEGQELFRHWIACGDRLREEDEKRICDGRSVENVGSSFDAVHSTSNTLPGGRCRGKCGVVYIIERHNRLVKIGISVEPRTRIKNIETMLGERLRYIFLSEECINFADIEPVMHWEFAARRKLGEWFDTDFILAVAMLRGFEFFDDDEEERIQKLKGAVNQMSKNIRH